MQADRFCGKTLVLRSISRQLSLMNRACADAADRIVSLYEEKARVWSRNRGREAILEKGWLAQFEKGLRAPATILDLGAGNGYPIAATLLDRGHKVVGIDSAASLIREAAASLPQGEWHFADMRVYDDERLFDGLIAWHSFFHLRPGDQREMIVRFSELVRPGGMLMFTTGPKPGVTIGEWEGEPLYHASLSQEEYRALLKKSGFDLLDAKADDPETGGATVWLARRRRS